LRHYHADLEKDVDIRIHIIRSFEIWT
jgi:hypothetical protein